MGQDLIQRPLIREDYKLWSRLHSDKLSDHGLWISYDLKYESQQDTLFVKSVYSDIQYSFSGCFDGRFAEDNFFACLNKTKQLQLLTLANGKIQNFCCVKKYDFASKDRFLITMEDRTDNTLNLCIRTSNGKLLLEIKNAVDYQLNLQGTALLYTTRENTISEAGILDLSKKMLPKKIFSNACQSIRSLTWSNDGKAAAFYTIYSGRTTVCFYELGKEKKFSLKALPTDSFTDKKICEHASIPLKISNDNSAVFFCYKSSITHKEESNIAEIWKTQDKYLFPENKLVQSHNRPLLAVWYPSTKVVNPISTEQFRWVALTGDQKYAVVADPLQYEPQYDLYAPMDYSIMSTAGANKELLVSRQSGQSYHMNFSPCGRYICYYQNSSWIIYDIIKKKHTNITAGLNPSFKSIIEENSNRKIVPFLFQGWSSDGKSLLLCDQYDLWQIYLDGKTSKRITNGREQYIRFRLVPSATNKNQKNNFSGSQCVVYDTTKTILLEVYDTQNGSSGYCILDLKKGVQPLYFKDAKISSIIKAAQNESYIFESENFDQSPSILYKKQGNTDPVILVQSNQQQKNRYWGHSKLITFENTKKQSLKGALFYPAQYEPSRKYPMVVFIYDKLSHKVHNYENPSFRSGSGFNITHFTTNGYFVLLPDIEYEIGNPGISAADCVQSAVKHINQMGLTNPLKIGIIAHSFGSYEVNFILTQSNVFAAAVSGAGISDNVRGYFTVNSEFNNAEVWRFENQQYRMGSSLYEDKAAYIRNSPLLNAEKINTPLLLWTGKNDINVKPEQSTAFYLALRRLNKKCIMLQYPDQGHILASPLAQEDLNNKIMDWLDYYLKGSLPKEWFCANAKEKPVMIDQ